MAQMTVKEIYNQMVKPLLSSERLKLATMILNDIPTHAVMDGYSEEWTEEDIRDFSAYSWNYILKQLEEEEEDAQTR